MKSSTLHAAVAAANITPPVGTILEGHFSANPSRAVLRPLEMRTLILRNAQTTVCIISIDAIAVTATTTAQIRKRVAHAAAVPEHNILIAASHTHCAPASLGVMGPPADPAFLKLIDHHAVDTAARAVQSLQPVTLGLACGSAHFNINRRPFPGTTEMAPNYGGLVDRRARCLRIDNQSGQPVALLFHYSCHPTAQNGSEGIISPDYPGFARAVIERNCGCCAVFLPGCCGNVRPNVLNEKGTFASATEQQLMELGSELARSIRNAAHSIRTAPADRLESSQIPLVLPFAPLPSEADLDAMIAAPHCHPLRLAWAKRLQEKIRSKTVPAEAHSFLQALGIGPLRLITLPGEPVQEIGHAVEQRLTPRTDAQDIWPVGYANDMLGYLCTERQKIEGGYEPNAYLYFDAPAGFDHEEQRIVDAAEQLVKASKCRDKTFS